MSAFEFYGALPEVLVPDNLKAGVTSPCYYEPVLNQAYAELARSAANPRDIVNASGVTAKLALSQFELGNTLA